jgi:hypothetical protein
LVQYLGKTFSINTNILICFGTKDMLISIVAKQDQFRAETWADFSRILISLNLYDDKIITKQIRTKIKVE